MSVIKIVMTYVLKTLSDFSVLKCINFMQIFKAWVSLNYSETHFCESSWLQAYVFDFEYSDDTYCLVKLMQFNLFSMLLYLQERKVFFLSFQG